MKTSLVLNLLLSMTTLMAIDRAAHASNPKPVSQIAANAATPTTAQVPAAAIPTSTTPYPDSPIIEDKMLFGEIKKACPIIVNTKRHGDVRLTHDESFEPASKKGREQVRGGWTVTKGKLILTWTQSGETESFNVKRASATDFTFSN